MFRIGTVAFTTLICVIAAELVLRALNPDFLPSAGPERKYFCRVDAELGWVPKTCVSGQHQRTGFSVFVHQNRFGLRGPDDMTRKKSRPGQRILVLGDSYVWGYGVNQAELFSDPAVHGAIEIELINMGVSGYGTDQAYLFYLREGRLFEADEVVLAVTIYNDVHNNLASEAYGYMKPQFELEAGELVLHSDHLRSGRIHNWWNDLCSALMIAKLYDRAQISSWYQRIDESMVVNPEDRRLDDHVVSEREHESLRLTAKIIESLGKAVKEDGAEFSVIIIPYKPHIELGLGVNHPYAEPLKQSLERSGIRCRDPYAKFREGHEKGTKIFNRYDSHFSAAGHALFASLLVSADAAEESRR